MYGNVIRNHKNQRTIDHSIHFNYLLLTYLLKSNPGNPVPATGYPGSSNRVPGSKTGSYVKSLQTIFIQGNTLVIRFRIMLRITPKLIITSLTQMLPFTINTWKISAKSVTTFPRSRQQSNYIRRTSKGYESKHVHKFLVVPARVTSTQKIHRNPCTNFESFCRQTHTYLIACPPM